MRQKIGPAREPRFWTAGASDVMTDEEKLDAAKQKYLDAKKEIEELRQAIADANCPLKIGDVITVVDDGKEYEGRIDHIHPISSPEEMLGPIVGKLSGWAAGGPRRNKTGEFGKWNFDINSFDSSFEKGKWVVKSPLTLEQRLGLPDPR
jgi:hypothetical protein